MIVTPSFARLQEGSDPLEGDLELRKELAGLFVADYPRLVSRIIQAMDERNGPELRMAAHTLKGSCGVFRDQGAFDTSLRLEQVGGDADWGQAEEAWERTREEIGRLESTLSCSTSTFRTHATMPLKEGLLDMRPQFKSELGGCTGDLVLAHFRVAASFAQFASFA